VQHHQVEQAAGGPQHRQQPYRRVKLFRLICSWLFAQPEELQWDKYAPETD